MIKVQFSLGIYGTTKELSEIVELDVDGMDEEEQEQFLQDELEEWTRNNSTFEIID